MSERKETYLGDGLYGSFDGFQFLLRAPREEGDHFVALEPEVLASFIGLVIEIYGIDGLENVIGRFVPRK